MDIENFFALYGEQELIKQRREEDKEARKAMGEGGQDGFQPKAQIPNVFKRPIGNKKTEDLQQQDSMDRMILNIPGGNDDSQMYYQD